MVSASQKPRNVSDLQREIAAQILDIARRDAMGAGSALRESVLAKEFSVSRTPVRAALDYLCAFGVVEHIPQRGYFLSSASKAMPEIDIETSDQASKRAYNRIVDSYFDGELTERISEAELIRRYQVERQPLQEALNRLAAEGLMRQNPGYGWQFAPLLKSRQADSEDLFRFRLLVEPAAFLEPGYKADPEVLLDVRNQQIDLLSKLDEQFDPAETYEANDRLHDVLVSFCGNRFLINALDFNDPSARMNEYQHYKDRPRIRAACEEHIAIIDAVQAGELVRASELMRQHISSAKRAGQ